MIWDSITNICFKRIKKFELENDFIYLKIFLERRFIIITKYIITSLQDVKPSRN